MHTEPENTTHWPGTGPGTFKLLDRIPELADSVSGLPVQRIVGSHLVCCARLSSQSAGLFLLFDRGSLCLDFSAICFAPSSQPCLSQARQPGQYPASRFLDPSDHAILTSAKWRCRSFFGKLQD